ncbi:MFS gliotoxin efflux transporter gliA [Hyphodiscus hymeniophilus]|uniref:MFS gliotoxin efflux transporter gliA n=1 Tax=Hyphodiscus hymeniophilus TaxID=353542 RepID=A0A9P7B138_9HELO|nr:MFS gliotoxin efflux transporter gliA [Hyphodiscus hymeniophilus]
MDSRSPTLAEETELETAATTSTQGSMLKEKSALDDGPTENEEKSIRVEIKGEADAEEGDDGGEYPSGIKMAFIVVALMLSIFLVSLDMTIVATAIPKITDEFHGLDLVGWYGSAFFLTLGSFQSTWGKAYKYFPLKLTYLVSIFVFELGSLICGVAPNAKALIVGRAIAGLGGAGIASGTYTIIAFAARPQKRPAFTGLLGASYGIASVIGPLLGGVFAEDVTWRWCFYINLPIGGLAGAIILIFFKTPPQAVPVRASFKEKMLQMDIPGTITIMCAVVCYILAMQWGGQSKSWNDGSVIACLVMFGVIIVLFCVVEYYQGDRAMVVGRLLKDRTISVGMGFIFFLAGAWFLILYYLPIYFQAVFHVTASQSGIRNLPLIIGGTISTILSGGLLTVYGYPVPFLIAGSMMTTIGCGLLYTLSTHSTSSAWIGYQALAGLGVGLALQVPVISAQAVVAPSDLSSATAMILFAQTIGGAFFVTAGEVAFSNTLLRKLPLMAPLVDPQSVAATGVTELRKTFPAATIPGIISAYMSGLKVAYAIAIAAGGLSVLLSFASKWRNLKGKVGAGAA